MRENLSVRKIFERSVYECVRNKIIESSPVCSFTLMSSSEYSFILVFFLQILIESLFVCILIFFCKRDIERN